MSSCLAALVQAELRVVGDVVAAAHEGVDGAQGFALAARQNEEGVVEILGGRARDALADGIRHDELRRSGGPGDDGTCCVPALIAAVLLRSDPKSFVRRRARPAPACAV